LETLPALRSNCCASGATGGSAFAAPGSAPLTQKFHCPDILPSPTLSGITPGCSEIRQLPG
jgi:hypothetical protein